MNEMMWFYKLVSVSGSWLETMNDLEDLVNEACGDGWEPLGGVSVVLLDGVRDNSEPNYRYIQAMKKLGSD